jgi:hypothetical protein
MARHVETDRVTGVLPLFRVPSLLGSPRLVSIPFRDRGGPVWDDPASFTALLEAAEVLRAREKAGWLELKSLTTFSPELVAAAGLQEHSYWVRSVAPLEGLDQKTLDRQLGDKTRNMLRQSARAGLTCTDVTDRPDVSSLWYGLHQATQRHLGLPPFPRRFFHTMIESLSAAGRLRLFAVEDSQGQALAASILLLDGTTGIYGYSASLPSSRALRPNDLLLYRMMTWLIEQGYSFFDLGSDSPRQEGLLFFKRKWLARQAPVPVYLSAGADYDAADSSAPRYALVRRITHHLPLPVARLCLAPLTRFFG